MLGWQFQKYTPNWAKPTNIAELKTALLSIWNDLPVLQEFVDKAITSFQDFDRVLLQLVDIFNTV